MYNILFKHASKRITAIVCAFALVITTMLSGVAFDVQAASASIEINGFQVSASAEGYRTVYSVTGASQVTSLGLIYGIKNYVSESDMVVGSSNAYVHSYAATSAGVSSTVVSGDATYVMTMKFINKAAYYSANLMVKAYAKLSDGSYVYSDVENFTIYDLAKNLYTNSKMTSEAGHNYLYSNILSVVNPSEAAVAYSPATTSDYVTASEAWNDGTAWSTYFASGWGGDPTGAIRDGGSYSDYGIRVDTAANGDWAIQAKTQVLTVVSGASYRATATVTSSAASTKNITFKDDVSGTSASYEVVAGSNTFTVDFTASSTTAQIFFELSGLAANSTFEITGFSLEQITEVTTTTTTKMDTSSIDWDSIDYITDGYGGGAYSDTYKFYCGDDTVSVVNIQSPGFASAAGIYVTFPAGISSCSLPAGTYDIDGAGIVLHLGAFSSGVTTFTVTDALGTHSCAVKATSGNTDVTTTTTSKVQYDSDNIDWDAIDFAGDGAGDGAYSNKYKFYSATNNVNLVNIQYPGFASAAGLYVTFPAGISSCSLDEGTYDIDGAGIVLHLDAFATGVTSFTVKYATGEATCYVKNYGSAQTETSSSNNTGDTGSLTAPAGLVVSMDTTNKTLTIAFSAVSAASYYNLYLNDSKYGTITNGGTINYNNLTAGATYTVAVTAVGSDGTESAKSSTTTVTIPTSGTVVTTTTTKSSSSSQIKYGYYPTNSGLAQPFGVVVSSPASNSIGVVWGAGTINSYNVYIDDVLTWSGIAASYKEAYGYVAGTHTVRLTTFSNGYESTSVVYNVTVSGLSSGVEPTTARTYSNSGNNYSDPVPALPSGVDTNGKNMYVKINNRSNGQYSDSQCYWVLVGLNENGVNCYVNTAGQAVPMSTADNTSYVNGQYTANYAHSLAECSFFYAPTTLTSGRLYLSYGAPIYLTVNDGGYAGPSVLNSSDPNAGTLFEFAEFTITNGHDMFTNTTRVDFFTFPMSTRLVGSGGYVNGQGDANTYDVTVGDMGTRSEIISQYLAGGSDAWDSLYNGTRIMAPCKSTFDSGKAYGTYFDAYINEFWTKYASQDLVFRCEGGNFTGRVSGDVMVFTKEGDSGTYYVYKPTTQDVLEGKGNFNRGNSTELVIEAQLCAAFTRGVACDPDNWSHEAFYYQSGTYNYYAGFFHKTSYDGFAYGFCYDDVFDHSTLLHYTNATGLIVDMKY